MPDAKTGYTDEEWFLQFYGEHQNRATIRTTDGIPLIFAERVGVTNERVKLIADQFQANLRVMAAARTMIDALEVMSTYPTCAENEAQGLNDQLCNARLDSFISLARNAVKKAKPELFDVTRDGTVPLEPEGRRKVFTGTHNECFAYILHHQGQSVDYALRWGGWKIEPHKDQE